MTEDATMPRKHASVGNAERKEPDFPNITKIMQQDRDMHVERAMEAGLSREAAQRHAEDDMKHWSPKHIEARPHEDD